MYFLHLRIEWQHLTLSVTLNGQIRYLYWSKIKSIYILLHFHKKYRFSEKFTWVGKYVILHVQVLWTLKIFRLWKFSTLKDCLDFEFFERFFFLLWKFFVFCFFFFWKFWLFNYLSSMIKLYLYFLYIFIYKWNKANI